MTNQTNSSKRADPYARITDRILAELEQYDPELLAKPRLVAANKMDENTAAANLKKFKRKHPGLEVLELMAALDEGVMAFKERLRAEPPPA